MAEQPRLGPVRVRVRMVRPGHDQPATIEPRLEVAPERPERKKRKPNNGSFHAGDGRPRPGRPKGAKNRKDGEAEARVRRATESARRVAAEVLSTLTTLNGPDGPREVSYFHGLLLKEMERASKGDERARKTMFEFARWAMIDQPDKAEEEELFDSPETNQAILDWFAAEIRRQEEQKLGKGGKS